jgi:hypothetical protein
MSDFDEFMTEKQEIDRYLAQGYSICGITEDLSGDWLELEPSASLISAQAVTQTGTEISTPTSAQISQSGQSAKDSSAAKVTLHIRTANARKYWTTLLLQP